MTKLTVLCGGLTKSAASSAMISAYGPIKD